MRATGRLTGPWVVELDARSPTHDPAAWLVLDLTDVSFVDRDGIEFLRTLRRLQIADLRCSAFVAEQSTLHNRYVVSGFSRTRPESSP